MEQRDLKIAIAKPFGNLFRKQCVLIAAETAGGKVLVGDKPYMFPPTIVRLLGGGVDEHEEPKAAAVRELREEIGVKVGIQALTPLLKFVVEATDEEGREFRNETFVYHVNIGDMKYKPGDDVERILAMSHEELSALGERYGLLPQKLWYKGPEGMYSWADYAQMYGPIHLAVAQKLHETRHPASHT